MEDRILFQTVSRVIINDKRGALEIRLNLAAMENCHHHVSNRHEHISQYTTEVILPRQDLIFQNGFGGFTADGAICNFNIER